MAYDGSRGSLLFTGGNSGIGRDGGGGQSIDSKWHLADESWARQTDRWDRIA